MASPRLARVGLPALAVLLLSVIACAQPAPDPDGLQPGPLRIYFLNVGQGDGALIITPEGKTALVDGGETSRGQELVSWLRSIGVTTIDWVMPSHPHVDHIGGLNAVLEQLPVRGALVSSQEHTTATYRRQMALLGSKGINVVQAKEGVALQLDKYVTATTLNPPPALLTTQEPLEDNSVVLRVCLAAICALFTGDIGNEGEEGLIDRYGRFPELLRSQVLKVSHHGSAEPNNPALLALISPEVAVIGAGAGNPFGHPTEKALQKLATTAATVYCTHVDGTVVVEVETDASGYRVVTLPDLVIRATSRGTPVSQPLVPGPCGPARPPAVSQGASPPPWPAVARGLSHGSAQGFPQARNRHCEEAVEGRQGRGRRGNLAGDWPAQPQIAPVFLPQTSQ